MTEHNLFICPSCGGKSQFSPNAKSIVCPNCDNEYSVRQEFISTNEGFARCPQCHRNDKVEKASSIVAAQTHTVTGSRPVTDYYQDSDGNTHSTTSSVSFTDRKTSDLARKLKKIEKPARPDKPSLYPTFAFAALAITTFGCIFEPTYPGHFVLSISDEIVTFLIVSFLFGIGAIITWKRYRRAQNDYSNVLAVFDNNLAKWENGMSRWNRLYYCFRDDCVFTLADNDYANVSNIEHYLYQD
jgi:hypothetical protein